MGEPFVQTFVRRTPNPVLLGLVSLVYLASASVAAWGLATGNALGFGAMHLFVLGTIGLATIYRTMPLARRAEVVVRVDRDTLTVGDDVVPRAAITRAWTVPHSSRIEGHVRIERRLRPAIELLVTSRTEADGLLEALGHDAASRHVTVYGLSRANALPGRTILQIVAVIVAMALGATLSEQPAPIPMLPALALMVVWLVPSRVSVGTDGVLVRWLGLTRFVPAAQVAFTEVYEQGYGRNRVIGVRVHLVAGAPLTLPVGQGGGRMHDVEALAARIDEVSWRSRQAQGLDESARLARGGRDVTDWLRALRAIGVGATESFRHHGVEREALWRVFESAASTPEARAAAAAALTARRDHDDASRVRVVADAVVDPALREAFVAAADGDDEALARSLAALTGVRTS